MAYKKAKKLEKKAKPINMEQEPPAQVIANLPKAVQESPLLPRAIDILSTKEYSAYADFIHTIVGRREALQEQVSKLYELEHRLVRDPRSFSVIYIGRNETHVL